MGASFIYSFFFLAEIDDVNQGLDHFHNGFDLVHVRCIMTGITNPDEAIREFTRCLKPGGILILIDGDKDFLDENFRKVHYPLLAPTLSNNKTWIGATSQNPR